MTKDELKQEAEEWLCNNLHSANEEDFIKAMIDISEPREKRIAELEQENKVLAQNLEDTEIVNKALEKENAELKNELKDLRESIKDYGAGCYENGLRNGKRKLEEQLTNAKDIIKNLMVYVPVDLKEYEEARQFLKDKTE